MSVAFPMPTGGNAEVGRDTPNDYRAASTLIIIQKMYHPLGDNAFLTFITQTEMFERAS